VNLLKRFSFKKVVLMLFQSKKVKEMIKIN